MFGFGLIETVISFVLIGALFFYEAIDAVANEGKDNPSYDRSKTIHKILIPLALADP